MAQQGERLIGLSGIEIMVTKTGEGTLTDGDLPLIPKGAKWNNPRLHRLGEPESFLLGRRYRDEASGIEILILKPGLCDLRCDGRVIEQMQPKVLPSAD